MVDSSSLEVCIAGLGADGGRAVAAVARAVRELWDRPGLAVEGVCIGDDERRALRTIRGWCDRRRVSVVLTVGRAGHGPGDFAPEITGALLGKPLPGIEERMHLDSPKGPSDLLFRGRAGMRGGTLVVNLPAHPARARAIVRFLGRVVAHAVEKARGSDRECAGARTSP